MTVKSNVCPLSNASPESSIINKPQKNGSMQSFKKLSNQKIIDSEVSNAIFLFCNQINYSKK